MKLATLRDGSRDGRLLVVRRDGEAGAPSPDAWPTLQRALDDWSAAEPALRALADQLDRGALDGIAIDPHRASARRCRARTSGSTARRTSTTSSSCARRAAPSRRRRSRPIRWSIRAARATCSGRAIRSSCTIRRGASTSSPRSASSSATRRSARPRPTRSRYVRLVMLANDCTLRNLIPDELAKGFGFFQSKPATAFSPFAVTPDELGAAWRDGRAAPARALDATTATLVGDCDAGPEMHFSFFDLIAAHREDAPVHRRHDPRQRHRVERRPRARHLVPRRAPDDRDDRGRQADDAVHGGRRSRSRSRRSTPTGASLFGKIDQRVVAAGGSR